MHMADETIPTDTGAPDTSQLGAEITTALSAADTTGAQRIQELQRVHQARASQSARTAAALKAQYGASDPAVKAAEANVAAETLTAARVGMSQLQAATPDPQVSAGGWALHGRVFDAQVQPRSGFTVFLVDGSKKYQQAYGFAYTDTGGYFLLNYAGPDAAAHDKSAKAAAKSAKVASAPDLFPEVANSKGEPVYLSSTPFEPFPGGATYLNIVLPSGNVPIGDPPAEIRDVAIPPTRKSGKKAKT
jgi:hypothetical protein